MKKLLMLFTILTAGLWGCSGHNPSADEPDVAIPTIGYLKIDSVLAYNRHLSLDMNDDGKHDISFGSEWVMEGQEACLYLFARAVAGSGSRILVSRSKPGSGNDPWTYALARGTLIRPQPDPAAEWSEVAESCTLLRIVDGESGQIGGPWANKTDHFIGFRIVAGSREQFGWLRVSHQAGERALTIHDLGVNLVPQEAIMAGKRNP